MSIDNNPDQKSNEMAAAKDAPAQGEAEFSADKRFSEPQLSGSSSIPEEVSSTDLAEIKAGIHKLSSSIEALSRKTANISETTARAVTEIKSRSEVYEKSVSQISKGSRNVLLALSIIAVIGLGFFSVISVFLVVELRKTSSAFNLFESKINEASPMASQLGQALNQIAELSKSQEAVLLAIAEFDKHLDVNLNKTSPEKQFQAIEKMMIAQGLRLAKMEREIQQARATSRKSDVSMLRKEIESAFRAQKEWAEGSAKKSINAVPSDVRPVDARPQYPRPDNRQAVPSP